MAEGHKRDTTLSKDVRCISENVHWTRASERGVSHLILVASVLASVRHRNIAEIAPKKRKNYLVVFRAFASVGGDGISN